MDLAEGAFTPRFARSARRIQTISARQSPMSATETPPVLRRA
jgi:hypothetical protein